MFVSLLYSLCISFIRLLRRKSASLKLGAFAHSDFHQLRLEILWSLGWKNHPSNKIKKKKTEIKIASNLLCWFDCVLHYVLFPSSLPRDTLLWWCVSMLYDKITLLNFSVNTYPLSIRRKRRRRLCTHTHINTSESRWRGTYSYCSMCVLYKLYIHTELPRKMVVFRLIIIRSSKEMNWNYVVYVCPLLFVECRIHHFNFNRTKKESKKKKKEKPSTGKTAALHTFFPVFFCCFSQ